MAGVLGELILSIKGVPSAPTSLSYTSANTSTSTTLCYYIRDKIHQSLWS